MEENHNRNEKKDIFLCLGSSDYLNIETVDWLEENTGMAINEPELVKFDQFPHSRDDQRDSLKKKKMEKSGEKLRMLLAINN